MRISIECEKCGSIYHVKVFTTRKHVINCVCPFCRHKERHEVGDD